MAFFVRRPLEKGGGRQVLGGDAGTIDGGSVFIFDVAAYPSPAKAFLGVEDQRRSEQDETQSDC
jgi:hypothetical protein